MTGTYLHRVCLEKLWQIDIRIVLVRINYKDDKNVSQFLQYGDLNSDHFGGDHYYYIPAVDYTI